jgi:hypothetical protein
MIDAKTIGTYLGLVIGLFIFLCSLLVLVAIPIGWVVSIVRAVRRFLRRKGGYEQNPGPSASKTHGADEGYIPDMKK